MINLSTKTARISQICNNHFFRKIIKIVLDLGLLVITLSIVKAWYAPVFGEVLPGLLWGGVIIGSNLLFGLFKQQYHTFGLRDLVAVGKAFFFSSTLLAVIIALQPHVMGLSVRALATTTIHTFVAWTVLRMALRALYERKRLLSLFTPETLAGGSNAIIVGGGTAGLLIANEIRNNQHQLGIKVIGFVDDDPRKQQVRIQGIPVLGTTTDLPCLIAEHDTPSVIIATPSAGGATVRRLSELARNAGATVMTVPGLFTLLDGETWKPAIQPVSIEDLLRREPIQLDQDALRHRIQDQTVLVTGAGGSIGSEICRQVAAFKPRRLVLLGRGEGSLWIVERNLRKQFPDLALSIELCDIRNRRRLSQAFGRWQPQVVFHAAAHKHVPFLEEHPEEAVENNIFGTRNVVETALKTGTHTFVNISTDKAVNPTNVLGASKYLAERLVFMASHKAARHARYVSVRFGNVLGSRGSVINIFKTQIEQGGPITITHPEMRRFFMTIPEASQLVLQAGLLGENGKVYVLDMGEAIRISDLAEDMIRLAGHEPGRDIEILYSGIRPGEKLFEEIFNGSEKECLSIHAKVREATPMPLDAERLLDAMELLRNALDTKESLRRKTFLDTFLNLIPGYAPASDGLGRYANDRKIA